MVNPEWLRYFVVLAETRNFTAAAEQLHLTPQAMSHAISGLEQHYKMKLVERGHRVKGLTPAGEALLDEAKALLTQLEQTDRLMAELRDDTPQGPITIASVGVVLNYLLPEILTRLVTQYPKLRPRLYAMRPSEAERWVASGEVDIGIIERPTRLAELASESIATSHYLIVGKPQPPRPWHELGYIVPRAFMANAADGIGCQAAQELEGKWPEQTHQRRIVAEVQQLDTAINLCASGLGVAFLPDVTVRDRLARGELAVVAEPPRPYVETYTAIWRRSVRPTPALRACLAALRACLAALRQAPTAEGNS